MIKCPYCQTKVIKYIGSTISLKGYECRKGHWFFLIKKSYNEEKKSQYKKYFRNRSV